MKKKIILIILPIVLFIVIISQYEFFLIQYARFFTINNGTKGADAIVLLSGGMSTRAPYAIELYKKNYAPLILITDEKLPNPAMRKLYLSSYEKVQRIANYLKVEVPLVALKSFKGGATSTFDEAYDLKLYSEKHNYRHLILVTDDFHSRRALYAFNKVFKKSDIQIECMGVKNAIFNEYNWWRSDKGISAYILEGIKLFVYVFTSKNVSYINNY